MRLAASNIAWRPQWRNEAYKLMAESGFTGLEIAPSLLFADAEDPFAPSIRMIHTVQHEIQTVDLKIVSMQSLFYGVENAALLGNTYKYAIFVHRMKQAIDLAGKLNVPNIVFGSPKQRRIPKNMALNEAYDRATETFKKLALHAENAGTRIAIEPCPVVYGTNFLNTFEEAYDFVEAINSPGLATMLDLGGMHLSGEMLPQKIKLEKIVHVHISEPWLAMPPINNNATYTLLEALVKAGYDRYVSIEMKEPKQGLKGLSQCMKLLRSATLAT